MPLSGEAIRTMNYVDDISVTLRRILTVLPSLTEEERQRIAEYIRDVRAQLRHSPQLTSSPSSVTLTVAIIGAGRTGAALLRQACAAAGSRRSCSKT